MRPATAVALVLVVGALAGVAAFGLLGGGGDLSARWVSETGVDTTPNHHALAGGRVGGESLVFAPISGRGNSTECRLAALHAGNGSVRWTDRVPRADCTLHSVADLTLSDLDGDGDPELLSTTTERAVFAHDPATGRVTFRRNLTAYGYSPPVVADLAPGGGREIVVVDVRGTVFVFATNGTTRWSHRLADYVWADPVVADVDGDGEPNLVVGGRAGNVTVFGPRGTVLARQQFATPVSSLALVRDDGGAPRAVVAATNGGTVAALSGTGDVRWTRALPEMAAVHAVGDGDDDGVREVYAVAADGVLRALSARDGSVEWSTRLTDADVQMTPPPALGDIDGDGDPELLAVTNDGFAAVVDPESGSVRARYGREVPIYVHPALLDTDGDGRPEPYVMYADGRVVALAYSE